MEQLKKWSKLILLIMMMPMIAGCGSDDDSSNVTLASYIQGSWRSYYATAYSNGQTINVDIDKTGAYSSLYFEVDFKQGGTLLMRGWVTDSNGISSWQEGTGTYVVKGESVTITDEAGAKLDALFDPKTKNLMLRIQTSSQGTLIVVNLFFRKM